MPEHFRSAPHKQLVILTFYMFSISLKSLKSEQHANSKSNQKNVSKHFPIRAPRNTLKIYEHNCISRVSTSWSLNVWSFVCGHSHPIIVYFLIPFIPWPSVSRLEERYFLGVFCFCFEISEIPKVINKHPFRNLNRNRKILLPRIWAMCCGKKCFIIILANF